ncbi:Murein DD-endopeptidase MepM and murein hydrolase activator NlpD, contain LysM domain [Novosphingobium sp. CF614]|uniref:M23 family metallopeptidase n=1 Tax=Novosphingobium sp. CF614 TaxID=1884364 RepID=UPI0008F05BD9|nr:M23 family metallopeptidase [Novosphingobium sp. CF614]SFG05393.1 Murein DD-endopeptidase MepM and murein hydrolase activator NlpD, contain LysM domain [Novosphingobium sp. CF614]
MGDHFVNSYDPRAWAGQWSPERAMEAHGVRRSVRQRQLLSLGLGAGVILAGALTAWLARPGEQGAAIIAQGGTPAIEPGVREIRRTIQLSGSGELRGALQSFGLSAEMAAKVAAAAAPALSAEGNIHAALVMHGKGGVLRFVRLEASNSDSSGVVVRLADGGGLTSNRVAPQIEERIMVSHGIMDGDSFYTSAVAVGVPNSLISPFAKALSFDFDFQREVAAGDAFELAYSQKVNAQGEAQGAPTLLYASLTTQTKSAAVYRFQQPGGPEEWYDASGRTVARSFMRTPVDGAHITSKFGMRFHPVLHYTRMHKGVDFAAPIGTPIYAAAPGIVSTASPNSCGGNWVIIDHDKGMQTRYFHLSRYAEGLHASQHVNQGETIGYVGVTGTCTTGPHLHYEVHMNGGAIDPLGILAANDSSQRKILTGSQLAQFGKVRDRIDVSRAQVSP